MRDDQRTPGSQGFGYLGGFTLGNVAIHGFHVAHTQIGRVKKVVLSTTLVLVLVASVLLQSLFPLVSAKEYELSPEVRNLLSESRPDTKKYLNLNQQGTAYNFVVPSTTEKKGGEPEHTGRVPDAYSASFGVDAKDGVSVTDTASKVTATLIPDFYARSGQKVKGDHFVYVTGNKKLVYTLQYNGVKEDIIVPEYSGNELDFTFKLQLPAGAEARLDGEGNIGIFTSDPKLFGNISFGSDADREKVEKARENGEKTHLLMTIPAPIIKDAGGNEHSDKGNFELSEKVSKKRTDNGPDQVQLPPDAPRALVAINEYELTIRAKDLRDLPYPLSVDPTMVVTAAGDFNKLNRESGVEVDGSQNLIRRSSLSGGTVNAWDVSSLLSTAQVGGTLQIYNGRAYNLLGATPPGSGNVRYATLAANGDVVDALSNGTTADDWTINATGFTQRGSFGTATYNGYLYVISGDTNAAEYAKINNDGSVGTWSTTSVVGTTPRHGSTDAVVAYNGYMYIVGGWSGSAGLDTTLYARINADGSLGTWATTGSALPDGGLVSVAVEAYNGYLYAAGGQKGLQGSQFVQYAKINSDGTLGNWVRTTDTSTDHFRGSLTILNGYAYILPGCLEANASSFCTQIPFAYWYAPVLASGEVGTWRNADGSNVSIREDHAATVYNGRLYYAGGCNTRNTFPPGNCTNTQQSISHSTPKAAGDLHNEAWNAGGTLTNTAETLGRGVAVYNGYMYAAGGYKNDLPVSVLQTVEYAQISASGNTSGWQVDASSPLINARVYHNLVAYNGYLYAIGGCSTASLVGCGAVWNNFEYAQINADGSLGVWTVSGNNLTTNRATQGAAVYNGYLYLLGGSGGASAGTTTEYAQLNPAGGDVVDPPGAALAWQAGPTIASSPNTGAAVYNGYIYLAGGGSFSSPVAKVYVSQINPTNGIMGSFSDANANDMNLARAAGFGLVATRGYLYAWGGNTTNSAEYVRINTDGTLGSWAATQAQSDPGFGGSYSSYVSDGSVLSTVNRAAGATQYQVINNGGSGKIANWSTATGTGTEVDRYLHASVAYNGYLYISGGCKQLVLQLGLPWCPVADRRTDIQRAVIGANGDLGNWTATTTGVPGGSNLGGHSMVAYDGYLYITGGSILTGGSALAFANNFQTATYSIALNASTGDTSGAWTTLSPLNTARGVFGTTILNGRWYVTGGANGSSLASTEVASFQSNGGLSVWNQASNQPFVTARGGHITVGNKDSIYVIGGCTGNCNATATLNDVQRGTLDANGHVTQWTTINTGSVPIGGGGTGFAQNGYLYVVGGEHNTQPTVTKQRTLFASILPNGNLGTWQDVGADSASKIGDERVFAASAVWNGRVYITGGISDADQTGLAAYSITRYATLQSIPRAGSFSRLYDFDTQVRPTKLITRGTKQAGANVSLNYRIRPTTGQTITTPNAFAIALDAFSSVAHGLKANDPVIFQTTGTLPAGLAGGHVYYAQPFPDSEEDVFFVTESPGGVTPVNYTTAGTGTLSFINANLFGSPQSVANLGYGGANAQTINLGSGVTLIRHFLLSYTIDDSQSAVFPDAGNETTISDFDVYFTANPGKRLRGGRTFTNGADRGLGVVP